VKQLRAAFGGTESSPAAWSRIEGEHLLHEAMRSGLVFKTIFSASGAMPPSGSATSRKLS